MVASVLLPDVYPHFFHVRDRLVVDKEEDRAVVLVEVLSQSRSGFVSTVIEVPLS